MKELRIEVVENGFVVWDARRNPEFRRHVFESPETLAVFIKNWGRDNMRDGLREMALKMDKAKFDAEMDFYLKKTKTSLQAVKEKYDAGLPKGVWLQHDGGECPVPPETIVRVQLSNTEQFCDKAKYFNWHMDGIKRIDRYIVME